MARHLLYFTAEDHYLYSSAGQPARARGQVLQRRARHRGVPRVPARAQGRALRRGRRPRRRGFPRGAGAAAARRRPRGDRAAAPGAALPGHAPRRRAVARQVAGAQRRNERLLLTSFTNTQQFAPWLDALEESGARLAGVYSVPLLAPALAARLAPRAQRVLVVTANRAGLRQCFIEDGKLRFARLERTVDMVPQALATFARSETLRLAQYLATLRALPRDGGPLQALVVAPPGERAAFEQALVSDARVAFQTIDSAQALGAVRLRQVPEGAGAEGSTCTSPRASRRASSSRAATIAGATSLAAAARRGRGGRARLRRVRAVSGGRWLETDEMRTRAADHAREARSAAERYARITAGLPGNRDHDREPARRGAGVPPHRRGERPAGVRVGACVAGSRAVSPDGSRRGELAAGTAGREPRDRARGAPPRRRAARTP